MKIASRGYAVALLSALIFFTGCATTFQGGSDIAQGRQALFRGDYPTALVIFKAPRKPARTTFTALSFGKEF